MSKNTLHRASESPEDLEADCSSSKRVRLTFDPNLPGDADSEFGDVIENRTRIGKRALVSGELTKNKEEGGDANNGPGSFEMHPSKRISFTSAKTRKGKEKTSGRRRISRNEEDQVRGGMNEDNRTTATIVPRLPKRQCALLLGFCGTGCNGMQIQKDVPTIEGLLFEAMVKAGAVSQDNADDPVKVNLARAARTDAGVHAAGNVVSIKMIVNVPGVPDIVSRINEELPPEIRLWGFVRVQNSFNARLSCDSRKYTYCFPTYLLIPPKLGSGLDRSLRTETESTLPAPLAPDDLTHPFWTDQNIKSSSKEDDLLRKRQWRISDDQIKSLREMTKRFEGTHNFYNFTVGKDFSDRSSQRHIKKVEIGDPAVYGNTEWISVLLHGQSFMLHQIRKMMSILILSCRTGTPPKVIEELYGPRIVFIPKMPSLGLLLENPVFDSYNAKVSRINEKLQLSDPDYRSPIDFDLHRDEIAMFKQEHIYAKMQAIEDQHGIFDAWIRSIDSYAGNDLLYLNDRGIIPEAAVIKRGERRNNPFREKRRFDLTSFPRGADDTIEEKDDEVEEEELVKNSNLVDMED